MVPNQVQEEIEKIIIEASDNEAFVVDIDLKKGKKSVLSIKVDTDTGISLADCAKISRKIGHWLEEEDVFDFPYKLEVSSPGIGYPLKLLRQYRQNINRNLRVVLDDHIEHKGKLIEVSPAFIILDKQAIKKKRKKKSKQEDNEEKEVQIPFSDIRSAVVILPF